MGDLYEIYMKVLGEATNSASISIEILRKAALLRQLKDSLSLSNLASLSTNSLSLSDPSDSVSINLFPENEDLNSILSNNLLSLSLSNGSVSHFPLLSLPNSIYPIFSHEHFNFSNISKQISSILSTQESFYLPIFPLYYALKLTLADSYKIHINLLWKQIFPQLETDEETSLYSILLSTPFPLFYISVSSIFLSFSFCLYLSLSSSQFTCRFTFSYPLQL
jgi:hypothetical protein